MIKPNQCQVLDSETLFHVKVLSTNLERVRGTQSRYAKLFATNRLTYTSFLIQNQPKLLNLIEESRMLLCKVTIYREAELFCFD